jgi:Spy/CpxP family protein refolding chaperone
MKTACIGKMIIFLAVLLLGYSTAYGRSSTLKDSNWPVTKSQKFQTHQRIGWRMHMIGEKLNLTDSQKVSIKAIFDADANQVKAIRQNSSLSQEQKRTEIKVIWQKRVQEVNSILTPQQQQKFAELKKNAFHKRHNQVKHRLAFLARRLDLTDEQKTSIKAVFTADANEIKAVRQDNSLTQEQKTAKIKGIWQNKQEQINAVLTPEQQAKLAELKKHHRFMGHKRMWRKQQQGQTVPDSNS